MLQDQKTVLGQLAWFLPIILFLAESHLPTAFIQAIDWNRWGWPLFIGYYVVLMLLMHLDARFGVNFLTKTPTSATISEDDAQAFVNQAYARARQAAAPYKTHRTTFQLFMVWFFILVGGALWQHGISKLSKETMELCVLALIVLSPFFLFAPALWYTSALNRADYNTGLWRLEWLTRHNLINAQRAFKGLALVQAGRFAEARGHCEGALVDANAGERKLLMKGLALSYRGLGDLESAQAKLEEAIDFPSPGIYTNVALIMLERGVTPDRAIAFADRAIALEKQLRMYNRLVYTFDNSEPIKRRLIRAWALVALGRGQELEPILQQEIPRMRKRQKSDYAEQCYLVARVRLAQDNRREATQWLQLAIDSDPEGGAGRIAQRVRATLLES